MDKQQWKKIQQLFNQAVALPESQREIFLQKNGQGDAELLKQVYALLAADEQGTHGIRASIDDAVNNALTQVLPALNQTIGRYTLESELGRGGMGQVYLARRSDQQFEHCVALKVIQQGTKTPELIQRFHSERQILANLNHPNICHLLDGGTTTEGIPYLVMDYIDGVTVDEYCQQQNLSIKECLKLFLKICDAVHYAHTNLVIHRDIKPANILVDQKGNPVLLDFGIAKLLAPAAMPHTVALTQIGSRVASLEYASPEQIRGEAITTASDAYSLGALLYQLLTGKKPLALSNLNNIAMEKTITETLPKKPSETVLEWINENNVSKTKQTQMIKRKQELSGDLDTILMMALRKDPQRRYRSVAQFAEDIQHYLAHRPVAARKESWQYLTKKFIQRHKFAVSAGVIFLALISGFGARETNLRLQAEQSEAIAQAESIAARAVASFLVDLFEIADPSQSQGNKVTAREVLDKGARTIETSLAEQPLIQARLLLTMALAYRNLGQFEPAILLMNKALSVSEKHEESSALSALIMSELGNIEHKRSNYSTAIKILKNALALQQTVLPGRHPDIGKTLNYLGFTFIEEGQYQEAASYLNRALDIRREHRSVEPGAFAETLHNLGSLNFYLTRYPEAKAYYQQAITIKKQQLGELHPSYLLSLGKMAHLSRKAGEYNGLEATLQTIVELRTMLHGKDHIEVSFAYTELGCFFEDTGDYHRAIEYYHNALSIDKKLFGENSHYVAIDLNNIAASFYKMRNHKQATELFRQSLAIREQLFADDDLRVARAKHNLAVALLDLEQYDEAYQLLQASYQARINALPAGHTLIALSRLRLGRYYTLVGKHQKAEQKILSALALLQQKYNDKHLLLANAWHTLARLKIKQGKFDEAIQLNHQAIDAVDINQFGDSTTLAFIRSTLGHALLLKGDYQEAEKVLIMSYKVLNEKLTQGAIETRLTTHHLIQAYQLSGKAPQAEQLRQIFASNT